MYVCCQVVLVVINSISCVIPACVKRRTLAHRTLAHWTLAHCNLALSVLTCAAGCDYISTHRLLTFMASSVFICCAMSACCPNEQCLYVNCSIKSLIDVQAQLHLASDIQGVVQNHPATQHAESIAFPRVSASEGACLHPVAIKHGHIMQSDSRRNVAGVDKGGHCVAQLTQFCRDQSASTLSPQAATDHWQSGSITSSPLESERLSAVPQPGTGLAALQSSAAIAATATTMASAPLDQQGADSKAAHDHGQLQLLLKDLQSALIGLCSFD